MGRYFLACVCVLHLALAVKVKVVMRSDEVDSKIEDDEVHTESWPRNTVRPYSKHNSRARGHEDKLIEYEEEKLTTTEKPHTQHPNEMIFPLIYRQSHINSMFKFGENWYTWSTEKRSDGSKAINYYICYDDPKRCDEVGWEKTEAVPKCAFEIDMLLADDRACVSRFGVEPHAGGACDAAEQMKISEIVHSCGPRIRSLWRFLRVGRRPAGVAKPADVNSLLCEDEEECYLSMEYRIHHDRITFSLHEPARGQTFKSLLKRGLDEPATSAPERPRTHKSKKTNHDVPLQRKKFHIRSKTKTEGKGIVKERNDSGYANRRFVKNQIKIREDSEESSESG